MKRLFLIAAAVSFVCGTVMAQEAKFDEAAIIKKIDKLELNTQNPKKATKAETWLALGDAYTEAGTVASTGLYRGMDEFTTKILMQNPEEGTETINGVEYVKYSNAYLDVYLKDMMVQFWRVKRNFVDGALKRELPLIRRLYELDPKNAEANGEKQAWRRSQIRIRRRLTTTIQKQIMHMHRMYLLLPMSSRNRLL